MYDGNVAVIGVGSVGSMILWRLSKIQDGVVGFEGSTVGNDNCAVGGDTRLFRRLYKEGVHYNGFLSRSSELWNELTSESGMEVFRNCGALNMAHQGSEVIQKMKSFAEATSVGYEFLTADDIKARFPQFHLAPEFVGMYDASGGFLWTDVAVRSASQIAESAGAVIHQGTEVVAVSSDSSGVTIEVGDGSKYRFRQVVLTGGARTFSLLPDKYREAMIVQRLVMTWFGLTKGAAYSPSEYPIVTLEHAGRHIYGAPSTDGASIKISGMVQNHPTSFSSFEFNQSVSTAERIEAGEAIRGLFEGISEFPVRATAYPEGYSAHGDPLIDYVDPHSRVLAATAFSGKGFKYASAVGEHVARCLTDKENVINAFASDTFLR